MSRPSLGLVILLGWLLLAVGVGCTGVSPYEREFLADPIMQFDPDPEENVLRQHLLNAREGSMGGYGGGGGGCGCN